MCGFAKLRVTHINMVNISRVSHVIKLSTYKGTQVIYASCKDHKVINYTCLNNINLLIKEIGYKNIYFKTWFAWIKLKISTLTYPYANCSCNQINDIMFLITLLN